MVEALAANRADDTLHVSTLPRGSWCRKNFLDSHSFHVLPKLTAEDPVAVSQGGTEGPVQTGMLRVVAARSIRPYDGQ